ncbi:hypothetical protein [Methanococcus voltae]|uniref:Uncharacterized protein n=1 Tax=Methanococcus voltae PS TaxID=523842 RepID=A0ABT2EYV4_METVO|nr:hypothetical protein [Methanococcus voltae]MBP2173252.1 hypothetical protein [Methanococcus voltae]MCS3922929.1 hypothetical protein [Methanococcus voltae PS]
MDIKTSIDKKINTKQRYILIKYLMNHKNSSISKIHGVTKLSKGFVCQYLCLLNSFGVVYYNMENKTKVYNINNKYIDILEDIISKKQYKYELNIKNKDYNINNKNINSFIENTDKYGSKTYKIHFKKYLNDYEIYELPGDEYWCITCQSKNCEHILELKLLLNEK